jgi:hypothetical protein
MVWALTLHVTNCANGAALAGASVSNGITFAYTDAYGDLLFYSDDPVGYNVGVSKSGFESRTVSLYASQAGTTVTTCLNQVSVPPPPPGGTSGGIRCFIATAATGSPQSDTIELLRDLRDRVSGQSLLAAGLIEAIYDEYWRFSPAVADEISSDELVKRGALIAVVQPLAAWFQLAAQLALAPDDGTAVKAQIKALAQACPIWLIPKSMVSLVARLRAGDMDGSDVPAALKRMAPELKMAASLPLVDWALLQPLEMSWRIAAERRDPVEEVAKWLGNAPVGPMAGHHAAQSQLEIATLLDLLAFDPAARSRLSERLSQALIGA